MWNVKKKWGVFLGILFTFSVVLSSTFCDIWAADTEKMCWVHMEEGKRWNVQVEVGEKDLYIGDYLLLYNEQKYNRLYVSNFDKVSYQSNNKKVISVDKKGKLNVKKAGKAVITVKYKGKTAKCNLTAVNSLAKERKYSKVSQNAKSAKKLISAYGTGITNKNRYKVLAARQNYYFDKNKGSGVAEINKGSKKIKQIVEPLNGRANMICNLVDQYGEQKNPFSESNSKRFKVKSIQGKGNTVTITLKSPVTNDQMFGARWKYFLDKNASMKNTDTAELLFTVSNRTFGQMDEVNALFKKGSNKIIIQTKMTMKKGKTYYVNGGYGWLNTKDEHRTPFIAQ